MNHSRNMSNGRNLFNRSYESVKRLPTFGQKKFFQALCAKCRDAGIEPDERPYTRADYACSIDRLIEKLNENGIPVKGNGKKFDAVIIVTDSENILAPSMQERLVEKKEGFENEK